MKFKLVSGDPTDYARWLSVDGHYSIQRFLYRKKAGYRDSQPCEPYYCVFSIRNHSKEIGEAKDFNTASNIANHDNHEYNMGV